MAKKVLDTIVNETGVSIDFGTSGNVTVLIDQLSPELQRHCMLHGLKQKLADGAALPKPATIEDKYENVREIADRLLAGQWSGRREGAGNDGGLLFRALCILYEGKQDREQVAEFLTGKTAAEKRALLLNPKVAAIVSTIRPKSTVDSDALLSELM